MFNKMEDNVCHRCANILNSIKSSRLTGMMLMAFAGLFLTFSNLFVQLAIETNKIRIPALELTFARSLVQLLLILPLMVAFKVKLVIDKENIGQVIIMGTSGYLSVAFIYLGIDKIPLGDATVITFTSPVFTTLFAFALLSESCSCIDGICGFISFAGVVIAARPNFIFGERREAVNIMVEGTIMSDERKEAIYMLGIGYVLLGAVFLSLYYVLTRKICRRQHVLVNIFYPSLFGCIFVPLMMIPNDTFLFPSCGKSIVYIIFVGVTAFGGLILLALSLRLENAGPLVLIRNLDIIYAFSLQYLIMHIVPSFWSIGGGAIIIVSTSVLAGRRWWASKNEKTKFTDEFEEDFGEETELLVQDDRSNVQDNTQH